MSNYDYLKSYYQNGMSNFIQKAQSAKVFMDKITEKLKTEFLQGQNLEIFTPENRLEIIYNQEQKWERNVQFKIPSGSSVLKTEVFVPLKILFVFQKMNHIQLQIQVDYIEGRVLDNFNIDSTFIAVWEDLGEKIKLFLDQKIHQEML